MSKPLAVYHGLFGRVALYNLDRSMAIHAHREGHLIFHVDGPASSIRIADHEYALSPEAAAAVSPWQPHNFQCSEEGVGAIFLVLYINPAWFLAAFDGPRWSFRFGRNMVELTPHIRQLVEAITLLLIHDNLGPSFERKLHELTQTCFNQTWEALPARNPRMLMDGRVCDFRVRNSMHLMEQRLVEGVVLDRIARDAGLSRPHFYKLFRQQLGVTPNLFLNTLRMEAAIARLSTTGQSVTTIGLDLGFASQASFSRFFIANVGISPTDYRRVARHLRSA